MLAVALSIERLLLVVSVSIDWLVLAVRLSISTTNQSRGYAELQAKLLSLSRNSKQAIAERSFHMVIIDQPEIVVSAIADVVAAVRSDKLRD